jgi:WD40 repeat protein
VAFDHAGTLLATASYAGQLDLWDVATHAHHGNPMRVTDDGFASVAFDPSGHLVAAGAAVGPVRVWRVAVQRPAFPPLSGVTSPITGTSFNSDGSLLATSSLLGTSRLWDAATGLSFGGELVASPRPGRIANSRLSSASATPSARMESCWPSRQSNRARCCGTWTRRCGNSARARSPAGT